MDPDVIRAWTAEERRRAAADLRIIADEAWDEPSLCAGWRCRDVLGHLVWLAERTRAGVFLDVMRTVRPPNSAIRRIGTRMGDRPPEELLDRLDAAAEGRFHLPGTGPEVALAEVLTHRADITRVTDGPTRSSDERTATAVDAYRQLWWYFGLPRAVHGARLVATDAGWAVGPEGGPEIRGPGQSLLVAIAGRRSARPELHGAVELLG
ncbi:MAG: maleylpyruvate isomerase family mycothiol-dependent enzyme [Microthrixaceae bacterium]